MIIKMHYLDLRNLLFIIKMSQDRRHRQDEMNDSRKSTRLVLLVVIVVNTQFEVLLLPRLSSVRRKEIEIAQNISLFDISQF